MTVTFTGPVAKSIRRYAEANAEKFAEVEYTQGGGGYDILLRPGWICDDYGDPVHVLVGRDGAREVLGAMRTVRPCRCPECQGEGR